MLHPEAIVVTATFRKSTQWELSENSENLGKIEAKSENILDGPKGQVEFF
jgi:hypothetical protein